MPQLEKVIYFTPFFWLCLFVYCLSRAFHFFPFHLESRVFFFTILNYKRFLSILQWTLFLFVCLKTSIIVFQNLEMLVFKHTLFGMAPGGLPDLNLPPEPLEEEPPRVLKTRELPLSREEIIAIKNLQVFERQMRKKVFYMLKPLEFPVESPEDPDIRRVVSMFIFHVEPHEYGRYLFDIVNPNSDLFAAFLKQWEDFHYPPNGPGI
uniref:Uncharacterized protein n=1 Tax=Populus davidiana TaxID=266767 RepID=A0A343DRA3_9ROSI|nr:hypothetical protein [Populus davidiana]ARX79196.1 hypothetical protein [Populus davidiana]